MCLLTHGQLVNDTCNDDLLKGFAMSLCGKTNLKGKQCNIGNIQKVVKILKQRISVECQPTEVQYLDTQTIVSADVVFYPNDLSFLFALKSRTHNHIMANNHGIEFFLAWEPE